MIGRARVLLLVAGWPVLLAVSPRSTFAQVEASRERIVELRALAATDSCNPTVYYALGLALLSRRQFDAADSALVEAVAIDPQFGQAWLARAVVQNGNRNRWERLRRQGEQAVERERIQRTSYARRAFLIDPFVDIRILVSASYQSAWPDFEQMLARAASRSGSIDSVPAGLLWMHALIATRTFHFAEAMADVEALLRVSSSLDASDSADAVPLRTNEFRYMLAALHQRTGNGREAARLYREVLANDIGNYMAHSQLARMFEADSNWPAALAAREAAVNINPEDHTLLIDLAVTLSRAGRWAEAEETLLRAAAMTPRDTRSLYRLGIAQQAQGKTDQAQATFTRYLAIAPRGSVAATPREDARRRLARLEEPR